MMQFPSIQTLSEAKSLLADLKSYENLSHKLWRRGKEQFYRNLDNSHVCRVEYHSSLGKDEAEAQAKLLFLRVFNYEPWVSEIVYIQNDSLGWWMKLYFDDMLLDMSFTCVEKKFKK